MEFEVIAAPKDGNPLFSTAVASFYGAGFVMTKSKSDKSRITSTSVMNNGYTDFKINYKGTYLSIKTKCRHRPRSQMPQKTDRWCMMNREWHQVKEFHLKFGHPVSAYPREMDRDRAVKRYRWMLEEIDEFLEADEIVEQADAMIDVIYFALGTLVEMGIQPDRLFDIVQTANMAKLWPDGKPHYNAEGKTIKPSTWEDPHAKLEAEIRRQYEEALGAGRDT